MTHLTLAAILLTATACGNNNSQGNNTDDQQPKTTIKVEFDADSAYAFTAAQCDFGPRVPGTQAHEKCAQWLTAKLNTWADSVIVQQGAVTTFDGKKFTAKNIIAQFNPTAERRLLLLAHWDCRPWADQDPDESKRNEPVMGANDAASGVAVLLEVARALKHTPAPLGVDILLVDLEDWGTTHQEDSWALGTQYWARHPHVPGYKPLYGILLDMVGARDAQFAPEYHSLKYAPSTVQLVWDTARESGFASFFRNDGGGAVTDDHVVVNETAGSACIDIIDARPNQPHGFFSHWHTTHDTMDNIDRAPLKAVGQTLLNIIYQ